MSLFVPSIGNVLISSDHHQQKEFSYEERPEFCNTLASVISQQFKIIALNTLIDQMIEEDPEYKVLSKNQEREKGKEKEKEVENENPYPEDYLIQKQHIVAAKKLMDEKKKDEPEYKLLKEMKAQETTIFEERKKTLSSNITFSEIKNLEDAIDYCKKIHAIHIGVKSLLSTSKEKVQQFLDKLEQFGSETYSIDPLTYNIKRELEVYDTALTFLHEVIEKTNNMLGYYSEIQENIKTFIFEGEGKRNGEFRKEWPFFFPQEGQL
jgi:hypothetical protein